MTLEVERVDGGYLVAASPPSVERAWSSLQPLSAEEATKRLRQIGADLRDIIGAMKSADENYEAGRTDRVRFFRRIRHRIESDAMEPDDLIIVRKELLDEESAISKVWLIGMLMLSGRSAASEEAVVKRLRRSQDGDELEVALRALAEWSPTSYERVAIDFIRPGNPTANERVRSWAMAYAGHLLRVGEAAALLEEIIRVATSEGETSIARRGARVALAEAAGLERAENLVFSGSDTDLHELITEARRRVRRR
ncbi:MAG TPA: hypothetical protein VEZ14_13480 [Dehalococcoidia bacterium]|nr:hypothetical protein [Dehalococcoidia bacterium]